MIQGALTKIMNGRSNVRPGQVIPTTPGNLLETNGVKAIYHAASVEGNVGEGFRAIDSINKCVTNALRLAESQLEPNDDSNSMLIPLLGIGTNLDSDRSTVTSLFDAAISYFINYPNSKVRTVLFLAWSTYELELCQSILANDQRTELLNQ